MQNKLTGRQDFQTKIFNNPINLLKAIKEHSLNYQESRYEMSVILDSIRTFLNTKQKESEDLQEYTRRFKTAKDIMESYIGGPIVMTKYIQLSDEYKLDKQKYQNNISNGKLESIEPNPYDEKKFEKSGRKILCVRVHGKFGQMQIRLNFEKFKSTEFLREQSVSQIFHRSQQHIEQS